jgi:hypothetical protein
MSAKVAVAAPAGNRAADGKVTLARIAARPIAAGAGRQ